jgi:hypothetical protein
MAYDTSRVQTQTFVPYLRPWVFTLELVFFIFVEFFLGVGSGKRAVTIAMATVTVTAAMTTTAAETAMTTTTTTTATAATTEASTDINR